MSGGNSLENPLDCDNYKRVDRMEMLCWSSALLCEILRQPGALKWRWKLIWIDRWSWQNINKITPPDKFIQHECTQLTTQTCFHHKIVNISPTLHINKHLNYIFALIKLLLTDIKATQPSYPQIAGRVSFSKNKLCKHYFSISPLAAFTSAAFFPPLC